MKRVLSLVLALVLVLGMIPMGFAADQTAGEILKGYNLLSGDEKGNLNEDKYLNRAEMMVILAQMNGKFAEAKAFALPASYTDLFGYGWAVPYIAYAELNEWTSGIGAGMFGPAGQVSVQQASYFMVEALGYADPADFTWATAVEKATSLGLLAGINGAAGSSIMRGDLFKMELAALNTNVKDGSMTLGVKLGVMKPAVLAVKSVSALNSKEIAVTFNMDLNEGSAEDEANYVVKVGGEAVDFTATLEEDNIVYLTIDDDQEIQAITSVNVEVDADVLGKDLKELGADYKTAFIFYDDNAPEIVGTEVDGNLLTVTFSEYVDSIGLIKVDGEVMDYDNDMPAKEIEITITSLDLEDGKYTASFANVADLQDDANVAGYLVTSFIVSDTSTAPKVVSLDQTGDYTFEIEFTKNLSGAPTVTAKNGGIDIVEAVNATSDDNIFEVVVDATLADDMYDDGNDIFSVAVTVTSYQAASNDMYGDKYTASFKLSLDSTAPVLVAGYNKVVGTTFELRFNEIIAVDGDTSDIIVVDSDGVKFDAWTLDTKLDTDDDATILVIDMDATIAADTYTITVASGTVEDESGNGNKAFTTTVKKTESSDDIMVLSASGNVDQITIEYSDEMGSSALVAANYKLDGASLPSGTALYFTDADKDTVLIDLPSGSVKDDSDVVLAISNKVLGADAQEIDSADLYQIVSGLEDNVKPVLKAAEKTNSTTITLTFSEDLEDTIVDATTLANFLSDFEVTINGVEVVISDASVDADEVVFTTDMAYNTSQTVVVEVVDNDYVMDTAGNMIVTGTKVTATK